MTRSEFKGFVERALEDVIRLAEQHAGKALPRNIAFSWLGQKSQPIRESISDVIVNRVFMDEEHIYPCVDIGVGDILEDGTLLIVSNVASYSPRPFGKNWTDRDGPFVYIIGQPFLNKINNKKVKESSAFGFIIPEMNKLKS
ncbi:MAG: hypothetical protein JWO20_640 [Candidatus Angelobacter sp.]|jgi:hypothetical protein|nr:hypothetical protein [Candidatus Angelobacter sp.]